MNPGNEPCNTRQKNCDGQQPPATRGQRSEETSVQKRPAVLQDITVLSLSESTLPILCCQTNTFASAIISSQGN
ncbi:Fibrous sheath CABYR-binding protein [Clarias magur]|uniref:Fibrous sheath CABYR-binding protein n=1 Tax=Clarias magur TaxID=1594786 RepID=A0A8J4UT68_CLAMG|nr:Fibrous sheath CABYR-binding protein [Clarias magur]